MTVTITRNDSDLAFQLGQGIWSQLRLELHDGAGQIANANGYTTGGKALSNVRFTYANATATVRADDVSWRATGGTLSATKAVLKIDSVVLVTINFGATQTAPANTALIIRWHADGLFNFLML